MTGNDAIDFHDTIATEFANRYESSAAFLERFQVWTNLFDRYITATDHILDLGCGSGIFSNYLADKAYTVTGIDGSITMIALCNQKKTAVNVRYVVQSLPLTDLAHYESQDVVIMSSLLEYMDDMPQMISQVRNLLKPNGLFIVSIPNQQSIYRRIERMTFKLLGRPRYVTHIRNRSTETAFNQQLTNLGFSVLEIAYFSSQDPVSTVLKPFLASKYVNNLLVGVYRKRG